MITESQRKLIENKYGKLIYKIANSINGDRAIASHEDNVQDLWMTALEAVDGFTKQNGGTNGDFDSFSKSFGFDKYIKTCLWTKKNNKGAKITKKHFVNGGVVEIDSTSARSLKDHRNPKDTISLNDIIQSFTSIDRSIIDLLSNDPESIKGTGVVNISYVSKALGMPWKVCEQYIKGISLKIGNDL